MIVLECSTASQVRGSVRIRRSTRQWLVIGVLFLAAFLGADRSHAQSCTGASCVATSCSPSAILAALPSSSNTNPTVTVSIPACSATAQTTNVLYTLPSAVTTLTIAGAGTANSGASTTGASSTCTQTQLLDDAGSSNFMWEFKLSYGQTLRISCMAIDPYSTSTQLITPLVVMGTCTSSGCPQLRVDNITFGLNTQWEEANNSSGASWMTRTDDVFGVEDHNTVPSGSQAELNNDNDSAYLGVGQYGDNSWAEPDTAGTANQFFLENNIWYTNSSGGMAMMDCDISDGQNGVADIGGCRAVCRYNEVYASSIGIGICLDHGTDTGGRLRSGRELSVYDNTYNCSNSGGCVTVDGGPSRGGTGYLFDNHAVFTNGGFASYWFDLTEYRTVYSAGTWGSCGGSGPWDKNDGTVYYTGTMTTTGSGVLTMTDTSKNWTTNQFIPAGAPYSVYDTTQGFWAEVKSNTSDTITIQGPISESGWTGFNNGDSYQILRATVCLDQPGRGADVYPSPLYVSVPLSGATPSQTGWDNEALDPIYQWGDTASGGNVNTPYATDTGRLIAYRDFYPQASGVQTSSSSPFSCNGSTGGTGWGTLANRPSSCSGACSANSPGCGYFATDQGSGGTLYIWVNDEWVQWYQPYTYPYPLNSEGTPDPSPNPPSASTGLTGTILPN